MILHNPFKKTIKIPVRVVNGSIGFFYDGKMPDLTEGVIGELILPDYAVKDEDLRARLQAEFVAEVIPTGSPLLIGMRFREVPEDLWDRLYRSGGRLLSEDRTLPDRPIRDTEASGLSDDPWRIDPISLVFVAVLLDEPLALRFRGTKKAVLEGGACIIPALPDERRRAESINHAYTLVSQVFEPRRRSHSGNVFKRARYLTGDRWHRLEDLRREHEVKFEREAFLQGTSGSKT